MTHSVRYAVNAKFSVERDNAVVTLVGDCQSSHDVNVANCYFLDELSVLGEDLHA